MNPVWSCCAGNCGCGADGVTGADAGGADSAGTDWTGSKAGASFDDSGTSLSA
jgi:hypothetical protein